MTLLDYFTQRTADGTFTAVTAYEGKKRVIFRGKVCAPEQVLEYRIDLPDCPQILLESSLGSHPIFTVVGIDSDPQTFFGTQNLIDGLDRFLGCKNKGGAV